MPLFPRLLNLGLLVAFVLVGGRNGRQVGTDALNPGVDHLETDGARSDRAGDACGRIGAHGLTAGNLETEGRDAAAGHGLASERTGNADRQITLDGMEPEGSLIAVMAEAPGEDAHLVEVERQAGTGRRHEGKVL